MGKRKPCSSPTAASTSWNANAGMALMMYDDIRESRKVESKILDFLESVYQAAAKRAEWDIEGFRL